MNTKRPNATGTRKAFFGKDTCLVFQMNAESKKVFLDIGKKGPSGWSWNKAKIDDEELAEILMVIEKKMDEASFYHSFGSKNTKIWVNRKDDQVYFRIEDQSKALNPAQQTVLAVLLRDAIVALNVDEDRMSRYEKPTVEVETLV